MRRLVLLTLLVLRLIAVEPVPAPPHVGEVAYRKVFSDLSEWVVQPAGCASVKADEVEIRAIGAGGTGVVGTRDVLGAVQYSQQSSFLITAGMGPILARYRGCQLELTARMRAKDVPEPSKPWEGVRLAINYRTSTGAFSQSANGNWGSFDRRAVTMLLRIPADLTDASLDIGLLAPAGLVGVEGVTLTVTGLPLSSLVPPAQPAHTGRIVPRLRGFNTGYRSPANLDAQRGIAALGGDWQANVFKLWFLARKDLAATDRELVTWLDEVEAALAVAHNARMLAVLHVGAWEWHVSAHGGNDRCYEDPVYADKLVEIYRTIAERYRGDRRIWAIELLNESVQRLPPAEGCQDYEGLMERCALAINQADPERTIIVQPEEWWGVRAFEKLRPIRASNLVYAAHIYSPFPVSHQGIPEVQGGKTSWTAHAYPGTIDGIRWDRDTLRRELQPVRDFQRAHGVHIVVSEFGCVRWAPGDSRQRLLSDMIDLFEDYGWDWMYHAYGDWMGWDITLGGDPRNSARPSAPTPAEELLRSWFAQNQRPFGGAAP